MRNLETSALILVGLSHATAPLALREQLTITRDELHQALADLSALSLDEVAIVTTCNRLEVYAVADDVAAGQRAIEHYLATFRQLPLGTLQPHLMVATGNGVSTYLMRVASGLESMILGEQQVIGQVQAALIEAQSQQVCGPILSHLFTQAVHAGKRARHETEICRHTPRSVTLQPIWQRLSSAIWKRLTHSSLGVVRWPTSRPRRCIASALERCVVSIALAPAQRN